MTEDLSYVCHHYQVQLKNMCNVFEFCFSRMEEMKYLDFLSFLSRLVGFCCCCVIYFYLLSVVCNCFIGRNKDVFCIFGIAQGKPG